ncbi:hypothetical protein TRFO_34061 [Tritrichomonas foetus]|uniref:Glycosyltransferase 61 catalytic domain-containing protein n=1 Tax=Tritrichomonas foetus TaxID=1144522 RepID=A0A1J4JLF8_9EUKA|nr:hypothetical protein TRFO_34061 [Tritrichomonas foetus]|eukprot:OHS99513.1 hypothetical protein TRFO_34061 [Tritrichomonas foetus]
MTFWRNQTRTFFFVLYFAFLVTLSLVYSCSSRTRILHFKDYFKPFDCIYRNDIPITRLFDYEMPYVSYNWTFDLSMHWNYSAAVIYIDRLVKIPRVSTLSNYMSQMSNLKITLSEFPSVFLTYECTLVKNNIFYHLSSQCQSDHKTVPQEFAGSFKSVLALCHSPMKNYAHFTFDVFCFLLYIPSNILETSVLASKHASLFSSEALKLLKIPRALVIKKNQYIFAEKAYSFIPHPCDSQYVHSLYRLRDFIKSVYGLDDENPEIMAFFNRDNSRHIENMKGIYKMAKRKYPQFKIIRETPNYKTYKENCQVYNKVLILFTPHGAGCVNLIFMQPKTVFCEIQSDLSKFAFYNIALQFNIFHVLCRIPDLPHFPTGAKPLLMETAMKMLEVAVGFVKNDFPPEYQADMPVFLK